MEKSSAAELIKSLMELSDRLNDIDAQLRRLPDDVERKALLRTLGSVMLDLDAGLIRPIVRQHPELDPDQP
jgi:hypothetical protein